MFGSPGLWNGVTRGLPFHHLSKKSSMFPLHRVCSHVPCFCSCRFQSTPNCKSPKGCIEPGPPAALRILAKLQHPFIVNMFGSFHDPRYIYMVLEYIVGGEFFTHLRKVLWRRSHDGHGNYWETYREASKRAMFTTKKIQKVILKCCIRTVAGWFQDLCL